MFRGAHSYFWNGCQYAFYTKTVMHAAHNATDWAFFWWCFLLDCRCDLQFQSILCRHHHMTLNLLQLPDFSSSAPWRVLIWGVSSEGSGMRSWNARTRNLKRQEEIKEGEEREAREMVMMKYKKVKLTMHFAPKVLKYQNTWWILPKKCS